ncbi:MAG: response regulator [Magnetococcales bacterium]|nr:response regulator [Magnetococcales bacterium]
MTAHLPASSPYPSDLKQAKKWLTRRYVLALSMIALLACASFGALTMVILQQESTGAVVNISGRQRMLSQRTTLFVQRMLLAENAADYQTFAEELGRATDLIELSHNGLTRGNVGLGLPATMSPTVAELYFKGAPSLDQRMRDYIQALRRVLATPFGQLHPDLDYIRFIQATAPGVLVKSLDQMVWQYQREGEAEIRKLHFMETAVLVSTLFTLLLEVLFIFRPMVRQVVNQMEQLRQVSDSLNQEIRHRQQVEESLRAARDLLEVRVEERTEALSREIAERQRMADDLRASEQRFRSVAETANDAIITIDDHGVIISWNRGAERLFHFTEAEMVGQLVERIMPAIYRERHRQGLIELQRGRAPHIINRVMEFSGLTREGMEFPLELSIATWAVGGRSFYSGILRDISDRKRAMEALKSAKEQAENATLIKSRFLATMSHEIRTPINSLLGMGELLLETTLTEEQRHFLEVSNQSGEALLALINDILDLSKIEAGQLDLETTPFDLPNLLKGTVEILQLLAVDKGNELVLELAEGLPCWVSGDPGRLRQVFLNLIGNAIKFTEKGRVTVTAQTMPDGELLFGVADTGIGIAEDKLEAIFQPFHQADSSVTRKHGGTGLGLTICREIIQHMGGDIRVESRVGEGSRFWVRVPLARTVSPGMVAEEAPVPQEDHPLFMPRQGGDPAILLVEDSEDNQQLIRAFLKKIPCRLMIAEHGVRALELVKAEVFDVILMDIQMPVMDGLTATRAIRAWERERGLPAVPILALTAHAMKEVADEVREAGCDLYLTKPISRKRLVEALQPYIG